MGDVSSHVTSNAIVLAVRRSRTGPLPRSAVGAGQMSRVDAVKIAVREGRATEGSWAR